MIDNFLTYLKYEKRASKHTLTSYQTDLNQFYKFLSYRHSIKIENTTATNVKAWIVELMNNNILPRTINRKLASLNSFFLFLKRNDIIVNNPLKNIKYLSTSRPLPKSVSLEKMTSLFDDEFFSDDFKGIRDKLLLETIYCTGIRLSELISIKIEDINFEKDNIRIIGKRNKSRIVPYPNSFDNSLKKYIQTRNQNFGTNNPYLFITDRGQKLYPMFVYRVVKRYLELVGVFTKNTPHSLRHSFATHLLDNGADLWSIKTALGHENLSTTQIYTHVSIKKLKEVHKNTHPRS